MSFHDTGNVTLGMVYNVIYISNITAGLNNQHMMQSLPLNVPTKMSKDI